MKTLTEIKREIAKDKYGCTFTKARSFLSKIEFELFLNEVAKRYATEAIKADRERVADQAHEICYTTEDKNGNTIIHIGKRAIDNLPIELK